MLQNEQTKLAMLVAAAEAQRWADEEQARERAIAAKVSSRPASSRRPDTRQHRHGILRDLLDVAQR